MLLLMSCLGSVVKSKEIFNHPQVILIWLTIIKTNISEITCCMEGPRDLLMLLVPMRCFCLSGFYLQGTSAALPDIRQPCKVTIFSKHNFSYFKHYFTSCSHYFNKYQLGIDLLFNLTSHTWLVFDGGLTSLAKGI